MTELIVIWDHHECPFPVRVDARIGGRDDLYRVTSPDTGGSWLVSADQLIGIREEA